jgi:hypothetical protein
MMSEGVVALAQNKLVLARQLFFRDAFARLHKPNVTPATSTTTVSTALTTTTTTTTSSTTSSADEARSAAVRAATEAVFSRAKDADVI